MKFEPSSKLLPPGDAEAHFLMNGIIADEDGGCDALHQFSAPHKFSSTKLFLLGFASGGGTARLVFGLPNSEELTAPDIKDPAKIYELKFRECP